MVKRLFLSLKIYGQIKRNKHIRNKLENIKSITVVGLSKGVGATCFSNMLGAFLSSIMHKKIGIIAVGDEEIASMKDNVGKAKLNIKSKDYNDVLIRHSFSINSVDYYYGLKSTYFDYLESKYDIVIRDITLGNSTTLVREDIIKALNGNLIFVIGSMLPWKSRECEKAMSWLMGQEIIRDEKMLTLTWNDNINELYKKNNKLNVNLIKQIPYEENPLVIGFDTTMWFRNLMINSF